MSTQRQEANSDPLGNRRAQRRAELRVEVMIASEYGYHPALSRDVSPMGLGLESALPLSLGMIIDVYFTLPSGVGIEARAEVVRCADRIVGLRFQGLRREERVELRTYCDGWRRQLLERCSNRALAPATALPSVIPSAYPKSRPTLTLRVPDLQSETRVRAAPIVAVSEPPAAANGTGRR
jgi:hypothetical protein